MSVKLISMTKPVDSDLCDLSPEELTAYIARVSNPNNQLNNETAHKLLKFCVKNNHWSVFEHVYFTVEISTSRAIAAQILRHRSATFQELSQRYSAVFENEFYPARRQDLKNRQNSIDDMTEEDKIWFENAQKENWEKSLSLYQEALSKNIAKEQSRMLLPLSTRTRLYMTNNLRNWLMYTELRTSNGTQLEHKIIAEEIKKIIVKEFPNVSIAMGWCNAE